MTWHIYALCEPDTGEIRYIGKCRDIAMRFMSHTSISASKAVRAWVESLDGTPRIIELAAPFESEGDALAFEESKIRELKPTGRLLNRMKHGTMSPRKRAPVFSGLGERVRALRTARDLSHRELKELVGLSMNISRIETGERVAVTVESAVLLARALNTTVEYLVTGELP